MHLKRTISSLLATSALMLAPLQGQAAEAHHTYDSDNRLIRTVVGDSATLYQYDGSGNLSGVVRYVNG